MRILVVDDEKDAILSLTLLLSGEGHEVRGVQRAAEVRDAIVDFAPDVVLLDIGMPQMTGYQVARTVREHYGSARPALVAVTGHAGSVDKRLAQLAGFDHHVAKPYEPTQLLSLLAMLPATTHSQRAGSRPRGPAGTAHRG
jgi:CheY-like chemotaxis protein